MVSKLLRLLLLVSLIVGVANISTVNTAVCSNYSKFDDKAPKKLDFINKKSNKTVINSGSNDSKTDAELSYFKKYLEASYVTNDSKYRKSSGIGIKEIAFVVAISVTIGVIYNYLKKIKQGNTQNTPKKEEKNSKQEDSGSEKKEEGWWVQPVQGIVAFIVCLVLYKIIKSLKSSVNCSSLSFCV